MFALEELQKMNKNELIKIIGNYISDQEIWSSGYQGLQKENAQLKAEIERLTEEKKTAWQKFKQKVDESIELSMLLDKRVGENANQKAEIERLTEELEKTKDNRDGWRNRAWNDEKVISQLTEKLDKANAKLIEEYGKNAELQKQVGKLKDIIGKRVVE